MLEGEALEKAIAGIMKRLRSVNLVYIMKIAKQIKRIGELNQSSINRLVAMEEMNADIAEIRELLRVTAAVNAKQLRTVFTKAMNETFTDPRFGKYLAKFPLKNSARQNIENFVQAIYRQTAANMYNYSNTTAITQGYVEAVDKAVLATASGVASYTEAMRDTIRELGYAGMKVQYESGYRRRLDTAVRQNIVDAVNQINKGASIMLGEKINEQAGETVYDAIEISAHARSAPDHEPVQGHVFMLEEYEKMQHGLAFKDIDGRLFAGFKRPIGEWNCRHTPLSFSTQYSKRKWTDEQLQKFIRENHEGCEIDGKHKTLYEAMQMMRDIETAVRREKDTAIAAKTAGDDELQQECQRNINSLVKRYEYIAKVSGNAEKRQRMTVEGFRAVKVPKDSEKGLTSGGESGTMSAEEWVEKNKPLTDSRVVPTLRQESDSWIASLTQEEKRSITKYTKNVGDTSEPKFFMRLNAMLRGDAPEDATLRYYADTISGAINKNTLLHNIVCYRTTSTSFFGSCKVGDIYYPKQFMSSSVRYKGKLQGGFTTVILAPAGSNGAYVEELSHYKRQREFLFNKDCMYRILELTETNAILEVIV